MKAGVKRLMLIVMGLALLGLVACDTGGVTDEDATAIREDLDTVQQRLDEIEGQMESLEAGDAEGEEVASNVREAVEEARTSAEEARTSLEPPADAATEGAGEPMGDPLAPDGGGGAPLDGNGTDPNQPAF